MTQSFFLNNNERITKNLWFYFGIIFLVNFFLKVIYLDYSSFWYDEIISVQSASLDFGHIKHVAEWDKNPPFYYYCLSVWIKLFNDSEFYVRLLSVVFSSAAGGVLFIFANKHFNKITAIIVSLLYISSNILFFYSHEARAYSLVVLLVLLSSHIYLNFKEKSTIGSVVLLGLINFLIVYTHYIAGLIIMVQVIVMLFNFDKKQKKYFLYSLIIVLVLVIIRFTQKQIFLILEFNSSDNIFWLKPPDFNFLLNVLASFLFNKELIIPLILIILFGTFLTFKFKQKQIGFVLIYTVLLSLGSIIATFLIGKLTPIFLDRYLLFTMPFIFLLIGYPLSFIKFKVIPIALGCVFMLFFLLKIDYKTAKPMDYKNTVTFIKQITTANDLVIVKTKDIKSLFCYYYEKDYFTLKKNNVSTNNIIFCSSWADVDRKIDQYKRIIVVDSFEDLNPYEPEFVSNLSLLKKKYAIVNYYRGVKITLYQ